MSAERGTEKHSRAWAWLGCALIFICLQISGCASGNIPSDYRLSEDSAVGMAAGTITFSAGECDNVGHVYRIFFLNVESKKHYMISSGPFFRAPDDELVTGWPFAVELPAGQYTITRWEIIMGAARLTSSESIEISFPMRAGKVAYLGNAHFAEDDRHLICAARAVTVSLVDKASRDIPLLRNRFAAITDAEVYPTVEKGERNKSVGGRGAYRPPPLIFPPLLFREGLQNPRRSQS